jgi:hypothetical protein
MSQESATDTSVAPPPTAKQAYYCWFKVTPIPGTPIKHPVDEPSLSAFAGGIGTRSTKRPPDLPAGQVQAGLGSWKLDNDNQGCFSSGMYVDYIVVKGTLEDIQKWPYQSPGKEWIQGSFTHFLMHFNVV